MSLLQSRRMPSREPGVRGAAASAATGCRCCGVEDRLRGAQRHLHNERVKKPPNALVGAIGSVDSTLIYCN